MEQRIKVLSNWISKRMELWIIALYLFTTVWFSYIAFFNTLYSIGLYLVFIIQAIGLILFVVLLLLRKYKSFRNLGIAASVVIVLQSFCIAAITIDNYKPTYTIQVPAGMEGCVYVFVTNKESGPVQIDEHGIGYVRNEGGNSDWELLRGNEDISALFASSPSHEIALYEEGGKVLIAYDVMCFPLHEVGREPVTSPYRIDDVCMDAEEFLELIELGIVDETRLRKRVWRGSGNGKDWVLDKQRSRW